MVAPPADVDEGVAIGNWKAGLNNKLVKEKKKKKKQRSKLKQHNCSDKLLGKQNTHTHTHTQCRKVKQKHEEKNQSEQKTVKESTKQDRKKRSCVWMS